MRRDAALGAWIRTLCFLWFRWRCPDCHAVHSCRPAQYLPGMQYPYHIQKSCLEAKIEEKPFLATISRQTQQHWWQAFLFNCRKTTNWNDPREFYRQSRLTGHYPVTKRRIYRAKWPVSPAPYLSFAVTVKKRPFSLE